MCIHTTHLLTQDRVLNLSQMFCHGAVPTTPFLQQAVVATTISDRDHDMPEELPAAPLETEAPELTDRPAKIQELPASLEVLPLLLVCRGITGSTHSKSFLYFVATSMKYACISSTGFA